LNSTVQLKILGREYRLRSQESTEQMHRVVKFVEARLSETAAGQSVDTGDVTVLTLLNLAGQYLQLQEQQMSMAESQERRLREIAAQLESALLDSP